MTPLYEISNIQVIGNDFTGTVTFNPSHDVFSGHFPGQPIVPGVVLVEIAAAVAGRVTGKDLFVREASVIKFLQVADPFVNPALTIEGSIIGEDNGSFKVNLIYRNGDKIFVKIKGLILLAKPAGSI